MGVSAAAQRLALENSVQAEADGSFLVRPFGMFGTVYELPNASVRDSYISGRILSQKILMPPWFIVIFVVFALYFALFFIFNISVSATRNIPLFLWPAILIVFSTIHFVIERRVLRSVGAHPVVRSRWCGPTAGGAFASADSHSLGCIFLLMVALSTLLATISFDSYFGNRSDEGMPYTMILAVFMGTAALSVATWRELRMRERRKARV